MIVTCEQCQTRFQLDDAKVPEGGATVRCSRCRHAFHIEHPGHAEPDSESPFEKPDLPVAAIAAPDSGEGMERTHAPVAAVSPGHLSGDRGAAEGPEDDEADWRFSDELPPVTNEDARNVFGFEAARGAVDDLLAPLSRSSDESSADDGDADREDATAVTEPGDRLAEPDGEPPLDDPGDASVEENERARTVIGSIPLVAASATDAEAPVALEAPVASEPVAAEQPAELRVRPAALWAGWVAVGAIFAGGLWAGVGAHPGAAGRGSSQAIGTIRAVDLRGRWVENAHAGMLYVVSGRLENPTQELRAAAGDLTVELLDDEGVPVAGAAPARIQAPHVARELGEATPESIRAAPAAGPRALAKGESRPFEAVFIGVPAAASRFRIRIAERAAAPPPAKTNPAVTPDDGVDPAADS